MRRLALALLVLVVGVAFAAGNLLSNSTRVSAAPSISSVTGSVGTGGVSQVIITGSGFAGQQCTPSSGTSPLVVSFSTGLVASALSCTPTQVIAAPCPTASGPVTVTVTNGDGSGVASLTTTITCTTTGGGVGGAVAAFFGITYFVSPTGSDTNDCQTATTACATIQEAVNRTRDGDIVAVFTGTYDIATPIEVPDLIFLQALPSTASAAVATIALASGTGGVTGCSTTGAGTRVLLRSATGQPIFHVTGAGSPVLFPVIQGFTLGGTTSFANPGAIQVDGASYAVISCNIIGQEDLPDVIGVLLKNADDVEVLNNTIHGSTQFPISPVLGPTPPVGGFGIVTSECLGEGHSDDAFIAGNLLAYNSNGGIYFCSDGTGGHIILLNTVRDNGRGIVLKDVNDAVIAANAVQDNYYDGFEILDTSADNIITDNSIESQDGPESTGMRLQGDGELFPLDNAIVGNFFRRNRINILVEGARRTLIGVDKTVMNSLEGKIGPVGHVFLIKPGNVMSASGDRTDIVLSLGNATGQAINSASPSFGQPSDTIISSNTIISDGPCTATRGCAIRLTAGVTVNIDATQNEWGVTDESEIRAQIWDKFHDSALGQVITYLAEGTPTVTVTPFPAPVPPYTYVPNPSSGAPLPPPNFPAPPVPGPALTAPPPPTAYIDPATGTYYVELTLCVTSANNAPVPDDPLTITVSDANGGPLGAISATTGSNGCFAGDVSAADAGSGAQPASVAIADPSGAVTTLTVAPGSPPYRPPSSPILTR